MEHRSHVPKFGNWDGEDNVPYTAYFDKARKGKSEGGKIINPNDPQANPDAFSDDVPPVHASPLRTTADPEVPSAAAATTLKPKHEHQASREDGDVRQFTDSPARHENAGRRAVNDMPHQRHGERGINQSDPHRRGNRTSVGSNRSIEQSPLHPHYQAKAAGKTGVSSPSSERKVSSESSHGLAPSTPARSRLRSAGRGDETPERGAAVPKFGDWDENNPASADGFSHIFNKVREEKQIESAKVPVMPMESPYNSSNRQDKTREESTICCCFPRRSKN
ncbi:RPM1-interacting protein 4-like protein [Cinnamomum micranthum f. kanehirae]|uniref:RPM1-interacting protein 4-like protein n=1 Tax=Cinnamomum micranthum f. kanehirae TaxID=337451 RepID=A0A3S3Q5Y8_9MAGN|nr:RPM1-interacting protein 4-like protein [Cinnamomum micranthum f. kanehirae]